MPEGIDVMAGLKNNADKKEFQLRTFSSIFIVLIVLGAIHYGKFAWAVTASVIALVSLSEYYRLLAHIKGIKLSPGVGYIFSLIFLIAATSENAQAIVLAMILSLCVFGVFTVEIFKRQIFRGISGAVHNAGGIISGVLYITVPWTCMIMLRDYIIGREILMTLFFCTWACDVGAYIGGKAFGSVKL